MRSFVALLLNEATRESVAAEIERLRPLSRAVAWVPPPNLHLTLRFLGNQTADRLREVERALEEIAATGSPFSMTLGGLGAFPGLDRPRILWVGVSEGGPAARALQLALEVALETRGFGRAARPWHPHLTIGRVFDDRRWRREAGPALREAVAGPARDFGLVPVRAISLMRSDLSPRGARYSELASLPLGGQAPRGPSPAGDHPPRADRGRAGHMERDVPGESGP
jgi:RNA 2',3'-cyclic 3'-phosphodiesterase